MRIQNLIKGPTFFLVLLGGTLVALTQYDCNTEFYKPDKQQFLEIAIKQQLMTAHPDTRYFAKWFDLNQDGEKEALVYVMHPDLCEHRLCPSYIFRWNTAQQVYKQIGQNKRTSPPFVVIPEKKEGWYTLRLSESEGILVEYQFNGARYVQHQHVEFKFTDDDTPYGAQLMSRASLQQSAPLFKE